MRDCHRRPWSGRLTRPNIILRGSSIVKDQGNSVVRGVVDSSKNADPDYETDEPALDMVSAFQQQLTNGGAFELINWTWDLKVSPVATKFLFVVT